MRRMFLWAAAGLTPFLWQAHLPAREPVPALVKPADDDGGCHGTAIDFFDTPKEAAAQAKKDGKLVMVLHVSGNFEDPRFT
jgi:hypothetical protein